MTRSLRNIAISFCLLGASYAQAEDATPREGAANRTLFAARALKPGEIVGASDFYTGDGELPAEAQLASLEGLEVKRTLYPGKTVSAGDLGPRTLVARNAIVAVEFIKGPLVITAEARALDDGAAGDLIRVMNIESRRTFAARVFSDNHVRAQ